MNIALAISRVELGNGVERARARLCKEETLVRERCGAEAMLSARVKSRQRRQIGSGWVGVRGEED